MCRPRVRCWTAVTLTALLVLAGCSRTPRYLRPIEADTPVAFNLWRAKNAHVLSADEWRWFEQVLQEQKYGIMQRGEATGSADIDAAARRLLDGRPLSEVMREGLQMLQRRRSTELAEMKAAYQRNDQRRHHIRPADTQMLDDFTLHQKELRDKIDRAEEQVAQLDAAFAAFERKAGR